MYACGSEHTVDAFAAQKPRIQPFNSGVCFGGACASTLHSAGRLATGRLDYPLSVGQTLNAEKKKKKRTVMSTLDA